MMFQEKICVQSFAIEMFPTSNDLVSPFKILWEIFIEAAKSPQTTVRMAVSRAVCSFIAKVTPFWPEQMITAFNGAIRGVEFHSLSAPLIISAYSLLSKYVAPPLLNNYFTFYLIEKQFQLDNQTFSEFTADIIQSMGHMSKDFLDQLLAHFLENIPPEPSRHIVRALSNLIAFYPEQFLEKTIEKLGSRPKEYISLFTWLLTSSEYDFGGIDISKLIDFCFDSLNDEESPVHLVDNTLLILSAYPKLKVEHVGDSVKLKDESHEVLLSIEKMKTKSSFYSLPLPLVLLKPAEDEGLLVINAKFTTIGKTVNTMTDEEKKEVAQLFAKFIERDYDEKVSSALRGLASCIEFIEFDNCLLKRIVTQKKQSWFHCLDIVRVIENVKVTTLEAPLVMALVRVMTEFCLDKNETLSKMACKVMPRLISTYSFEEVTNEIIRFIPFFETDSTAKIVRLLFSVLKEFQDQSFLHLNWLICALMELIVYECHNLTFLGDVFQFFATFSLSFNGHLTKKITVIAQTVVVAYYEAITEKLWPTTLRVSDCIEMKKAVKSFMETHTMDIVSSAKFAAGGFLKPLKYAVRFVLKNPDVTGFNIELCNRLFTVVPYECSLFIQDSLARADMSPLIAKGHKLLTHVSCLDTFAIWCDILRRTRDAKFSETVSFVSVVACHYLHQRHVQDLKLAGSFCSYLSEMYEKGQQEVSHFISQLSKNQVNEIFGHLKSSDTFLDEVAKKLGMSPEPSAPKHLFAYKRPEFNIDTDNLQNSIRYAFLCEDIGFLRDVLRYCDEKNVTIPFEWFGECPLKLVDEVTKYVWNHIDDEYEVVKALKSVNTEWRSLAIKVIQRDPEALIIALSTKEKVTKAEIQNLCRLVGVVDFNKLRLLNLANIIFYEANKAKRIKVALRFFTSALENSGVVSDDLIVDFLNSIKQRMERVSLSEIALCMKIVSKLVEDKYIFYSFINKLDSEWHDASVVRGSFYQVKLMFFDSSNSLPGFFAFDEESVIKSYLTSEMPSALATGLRLLKQAIYVMPDQAAASKIESLVNVMVSRLFRLMHMPWASHLVAEIVEAVFSNSVFSGAQNRILVAFDYALTDSPSLPYYSLNMEWLPTVVSKVADFEPLIEKSNLFANIKDLEGFNLAMSVLKAQLRRLFSSQRSRAIMYAVLTFLSNHAQNQSYFTLYYLIELSKLCDGVPDMLMNLAGTGLASVRFFPLCVCLAAAVKRATDKGAIVAIIRDLEDRLATDSQKQAFKLIEGDFDSKQLIELASKDGN